MKNIALVLAFLVGIFTLSCDTPKRKAPYTGSEVYSKFCVACHGKDGKKGLANAADLSVLNRTMDEKILVITHGKGSMNPFGKSLSSEEIKNVAEYIDSLKQ